MHNLILHSEIYMYIYSVWTKLRLLSDAFRKKIVFFLTMRFNFIVDLDLSMNPQWGDGRGYYCFWCPFWSTRAR